MRSLFRILIAISASSSAQTLEFSRDIRPILSDKCFTCHGPDEATRKVNLRLDTEEGAKTARGGKTPVVAGNAAASEMYRRISAPNAALRMPPAYASGKQLTGREIALIKNWIEQGARWQSHWAFVTPKRPAEPVVKNAKWIIRNPIDSFVLARLEREGIAPSGEATKAMLLRRVTLDLTGVPPSPDEVSDFLKDTTPGGYEKVVDRLLASPRYGERMAVEWLDAARYADTHGYQVDPEKQMWAWRDWVIGAFNRNLPFDQFTIEQIGGDLLPGATLEQQIASGFNRNHRVNTEAGSIAAEFHVENLVDRVSTTGTVWMGLTIGCARCHDHKFDPITSRDFYSMAAFFNGMPEVGTGGPRDGRGNLQPYLKLPAPELEAQLSDVAEKLKAARAALRAVEEKLAPGQAEWEKSWREHTPRWQVLRPLGVTSQSGAKFQTLADDSVLVSGGGIARDIYTAAVETRLQNITAFRLELLPDASLPGGGSGYGPNGKAEVTLFEVTAMGGRAVDLSQVTATFQSPETILERVVRPMLQVRRGWSVEPDVTHAHAAVFETRMLTQGGKFIIRIGNEVGDETLAGRFRLSVTSDEFPEVISRETAALLDKPGAERTKEESAKVRRFYLTHPLERRMENDKVQKLDGQRRGIENQIPSTMVMKDMTSLRESYVLERGAYDKRGAKVEPAVPGFLPPLPSSAPRNRLGLARWIADKENPLTARVAMNRYWQQYFGNGLVKTAEDFGAQGESPSHPELLDWLATEFMRTGWDVKAMQKLIVLSATYRQTSQATAAAVERDPENRLLARGPRFRLQAEMIRDQALAAAGLLVEKLGGPAVKPYQPDGLWEQLSVVDDKKLYERSTGPDLWRRSVYTYWKRTVPPPSLTTFDAPTREFCVVKRPMSSTPLQALALLNDEIYVEAARKLAERMIVEGGTSVEQRLAYGFRLAAARDARPAEIAVLRKGLERRLAAYQKDGKAAEKLLAAGEAPRSKSINASELAAYATAASVILNLDEVVTKQ